MKFVLGKAVITPAAQNEIERANKHPFDYLERHAKGDWGDLCQEDKESNESALLAGMGRLFSSYNLEADERIWIITEVDRSSTTILLPSEY